MLKKEEILKSFPWWQVQEILVKSWKKREHYSKMRNKIVLMSFTIILWISWIPGNENNDRNTEQSKRKLKKYPVKWNIGITNISDYTSDIWLTQGQEDLLDFSMLFCCNFSFLFCDSSSTLTLNSSRTILVGIFLLWF